MKLLVIKLFNNIFCILVHAVKRIDSWWPLLYSSQLMKLLKKYDKILDKPFFVLFGPDQFLGIIFHFTVALPSFIEMSGFAEKN